MIGDAPLSKSTYVPGWHSTSEEDALIQLVRQYVPDNGVIVEIGTEYGRTTAEFAYACQGKENIKIVTVDLFPDNHHIAAQYGGLFNVWQRNLTEAGILSYKNVSVTPARGDSGEIGGNWNTPVDFLYIDGDHTFEGVNRDITAWIRHLKPGGIVVFHDYWKNEQSHPIHRQVKRAVDSYFDNPATIKGYWRRVELPDSLVAFVKDENADKLPKISIQQSPVESGASTDKPATKAQKATRKPRAKKTT